MLLSKAHELVDKYIETVLTGKTLDKDFYSGSFVWFDENAKNQEETDYEQFMELVDNTVRSLFIEALYDQYLAARTDMENILIDAWKEIL